MKNKTILLILFASIFLVGCYPDIANGEHWYCEGKSFFDVIETSPKASVRFTCEEKGREFEITFDLPDNEGLVGIIRNVTGNTYLGVVLENNKLTQLYEAYPTKTETLWGVGK